MDPNLDTQALQAINALQRPGKPNLLERVLGLFNSESPKSMAQIADGLASGDLEMIRFGSHSLKSSSANVGAVLLSQRCKDIEAAARAQDKELCTELCSDLTSIHEAALNALHSYLDSAA